MQFSEQKPQMAGWRRTADASDPSRSIRADPDVPESTFTNRWSAARRPRLPPAGQGAGRESKQLAGADIAAMSPLQIGLPG